MLQPSSQSCAPTRVLILGGSSEATALARALARSAEVAATLSLAGRTTSPPALPVAMRLGGFGGADGLLHYLQAEAVDILVDATHPFATRMAANAREAAARAGCRILKVSRPQWTPQAGDRWEEVETMAAATAALGRTSRRVFLTVGSLQFGPFAGAPQHRYLVRTIDPVAIHGFVDAVFIEARGPFEVAAEERLMRDHRIDVLVTKNSGGAATAPKLEAARRLRLPVILVRRPSEAVSLTVDDALAAILSHRASARRGV